MTGQQLNTESEWKSRQLGRVREREQHILEILRKNGRAAASEFHKVNHALDTGLTFDALLSLSKQGKIVYQRKQLNSYWQLNQAQCHH